MSTIPSQQNFPTSRQIPDHSIMDLNGKQTYLGNTFAIPINGVSLSNTSETNVILMTNPSTQKVKSLFLNLRRFCSSAQQVTVKIYSNPTISGTTTALTPINLRPANSNTSVSACYNASNFSVSANGSLISAIGVPANFTEIVDSTMMLILDPGQSVLITATAGTANTVLNTDLSWYEL